MRVVKKLLALLGLLSACIGYAQNYPSPQTGVWVAKDFRFHTGEVMPEVRLAYTTVGDPRGEPVVLLHGTTSAGGSFLTPELAGELFGPGQALDAQKYFIILPDALGAGRSSKPSDGLRTQFPRFNYDDMVAAHHRLLTEGLGLQHVRMVLGNSMGGMHAWVWGVTHPDFMDVLVPMASTPNPMSGRNWMMRRFIVESIRRDPAWLNGNYTTQPPSLQFANVFFTLATNGGDQGLYRKAPTREQADAWLDQSLKAPSTADANNHLYLWEASRDYNPNPHLEKIKAKVLAINSADDERNPPSLGLMEKALQRMPTARLLLIPASDQTSGHGTTGQAKWWKAELMGLLAQTPRGSAPR
ncbi:alpha/beta fold hydrolase [Limnohabitans sp.]|uniref:alpha/beta fold hydrolase n=1 Tax=Limnohabitans sp. TaxID=1907725 RepID=UPI0038B8BA3C